jgi:hypothetical protein
MSILSKSLCLLPLSLCFLACSSTEEPAPVDATPIVYTQESYIKELQNIQCATHQTLCETGNFELERNLCESRILGQFQSLAQIHYTEGKEFDNSIAERCLNRLKRLQPQIKTTKALFPNGFGTECIAPFHFPNVELANLGESCTSLSQCKSAPGQEVECLSTNGSGSSRVCVEVKYAGATEQSVCEAMMVVKKGAEKTDPSMNTEGNSEKEKETKKGDPNQDPIFDCSATPGLFCSQLTHVCERLQPVGNACTEGSECESDLCILKSNSDNEFVGVCTARLSLQETCDIGLSSCEKGLTCSKAEGSCQKIRVFGEACTHGDQCASSICINGACSKVSPPELCKEKVAEENTETPQK